MNRSAKLTIAAGVGLVGVVVVLRMRASSSASSASSAYAPTFLGQQVPATVPSTPAVGSQDYGDALDTGDDSGGPLPTGDTGGDYSQPAPGSPSGVGGQSLGLSGYVPAPTYSSPSSGSMIQPTAANAYNPTTGIAVGGPGVPVALGGGGIIASGGTVGGGKPGLVF